MRKARSIRFISESSENNIRSAQMIIVIVFGSKEAPLHIKSILDKTDELVEKKVLEEYTTTEAEICMEIVAFAPQSITSDDLVAHYKTVSTNYVVYVEKNTAQ